VCFRDLYISKEKRNAHREDFGAYRNTIRAIRILLAILCELLDVQIDISLFVVKLGLLPIRSLSFFEICTFRAKYQPKKLWSLLKYNSPNSHSPDDTLRVVRRTN